MISNSSYSNFQKTRSLFCNYRNYTLLKDCPTITISIVWKKKFLNRKKKFQNLKKSSQSYNQRKNNQRPWPLIENSQNLRILKTLSLIKTVHATNSKSTISTWCIKSMTWWKNLTTSISKMSNSFWNKLKSRWSPINKHTKSSVSFQNWWISTYSTTKKSFLRKNSLICSKWFLKLKAFVCMIWR